MGLEVVLKMEFLEGVSFIQFFTSILILSNCILVLVNPGDISEQAGRGGRLILHGAFILEEGQTIYRLLQ